MRAKVNSSIHCTVGESIFHLCVFYFHYYFYYYFYYYFCYFSKVRFAIRRLLFAESLEEKHSSSALGKMFDIFLKCPKKAQNCRICRIIFTADDNLREQLAEIVRSADCALQHQGCQLEMEDYTVMRGHAARHLEEKKGVSSQK